MAKLSEFENKQYDWLKKEIETDLAETRSLERNALLGSGAVWLWLLTESSGKLAAGYAQLAWWLPVGLIVLSALRCWALYARVSPKAVYMRQMEVIAEEQSTLVGWDRYLETQYQLDSGWKLRLSGAASLVFWVLLFAGAVWLAGVFQDGPATGKQSTTVTTTTTTTVQR